MTEIRDWKQIETDFTSTLLVGNGASISVDHCFRYDRLLSAAREDGVITSQHEAIFKYLETEDFELVLRILWHAYFVNSILGVQESITNQAYASIRDALIATVRKHHVLYATAEAHLQPIHRFMRRFKTVLSLNYDLIVYWAMLRGNQEYGRWFKDAFALEYQQFDTSWKKYREPFGAAGATLVFYPHGNLALATAITGDEYKLSVPGNYAGDLLEYVVDQWRVGRVTPLFVSEGTSRQKLSAIGRSEYLRTVYHEVLPDVGPDVTIFGWGLGDHDVHILNQIGKSARRAAVSVYRGNRTETEIEAECASRLALLTRYGITDVMFFWSETPGCWTAA